MINFIGIYIHGYSQDYRCISYLLQVHLTYLEATKNSKLHVNITRIRHVNIIYTFKNNLIIFSSDS